MRWTRYSIAGLMAVVLIAAFGLAALRSGSVGWASAMASVTSSVVILATVGALCRRGEERPGWIGFALFGWCFLLYTFGFGYPPFWRLLDTSVEHMRYIFGSTSPRRSFGGDDGHFYMVWKCIACLFIATFGSIASRFLFGTPVERADPVGRGHVRWGGRWLFGLVVAASIVLVAFTWSPGRCSGFAFALTWGLLGLASVAAIAGRGTRRVMGLGAAAFGIGYMLLIFPADKENLTWQYVAFSQVIHDISEYLPDVVPEVPPSPDSPLASNARVVKALDERIPLHFPDETSLENVLKKIQSDLKEKIQISVDRVALMEAEQSLGSLVKFDLEGMPLRTSLRLVLAQLRLTYYVKDGVLVIWDEDDDDPRPAFPEDPRLIMGHCFMALFASLIGAILAPFAAGRAEA